MPRYKVIAIELCEMKSIYYVEAEDEKDAEEKVEYGDVHPHTSRLLNVDKTISITVEEAAP